MPRALRAAAPIVANQGVRHYTVACQCEEYGEAVIVSERGVAAGPDAQPATRAQAGWRRGQRLGQCYSCTKVVFLELH